jgi:hypothetical protein
MMSPEWDVMMQGWTEDDVARSAKVLLAAQRLRLRLANAELAEIRDKLRANEPDLLAGQQRLQNATANLEDTETVLEAAAGFINIAGRLVSLVV